MEIVDDPNDIDESLIGHLEEEALKRRLKIQELRNKRKLPGQSDATESLDNNSKTNLPKPKFRSYIPTDEALKQNTIQTIKPDDVRHQITDLLEHKVNDALLEDIDLTKLAPKKGIDWDLKRNIQKKLDKLERRTQTALADLLRQRIMSNKGNIENFDQAIDNLTILETGENYD